MEQIKNCVKIKKHTDDRPCLDVSDVGHGILSNLKTDKEGIIKSDELKHLGIEFKIKSDDLSIELTSYKYPINAYIQIVVTKSTFGDRPWLQCPRCKTRRKKLYEFRRLFYCRECLGLRYSSQDVPRSHAMLFATYNRQTKLIGDLRRVRCLFYRGKLTRRAAGLMQKIVDIHSNVQMIA
ncbi:MAG: hypothetical protein PHS79_03390 [Patescibacteria group bacterium]|nr:hypothetical protein [Patescibacteria group bacterium]